MARLTVKQKLFVKALAKTKNGTQAVYDAGYDPASRKNAGIMASQLLTNSKVKTALNEILDRAYPDFDAKIGEWMYAALSAPVASAREEAGTGDVPPLTWDQKLKALDAEKLKSVYMTL